VFEMDSALFVGGDCSIADQHFVIDSVRFGSGGRLTLTTAPRPQGVGDQELGMAYDAGSYVACEILLNNTQLLLLNGYITSISRSMGSIPPVAFNDSSKHFEIVSDGRCMVYNAVTGQREVISPTKLLTEGSVDARRDEK
jgi:hypothetical protein